MRLSVQDLRKNYDGLNVEFDLWKGESDVNDLIPGMVADFKKSGVTYISEGALVIDVKEETDTKEMPPALILKSDGASLYITTDLATILDRMTNISPDAMIYMTDKRQSMHFEQLFRSARKAGLVPPDMPLRFLGFGTMNGTDGKPFKTRDGGVMSLEQLVSDINEEMYRKIIANRNIAEDEARETARVVGLAALKYGDLSNQAAKDYIFDIDRFTSFEGDTGPYILYTIVRIKSILAKYTEAGGIVDKNALHEPETAEEKALMLTLTGFNAMIEAAYEEIAPHRIAAYIYELANALNTFYHQTKILTESVNEKKAAYIALLALTKGVLETCIDLLGFSAPERM
jgi:arginyl-tRNA synthetase